MRILFSVSPAISLLLLASAVTAQTPNYRLLKTVIPSRYSLDLILDPEATTYTGLVEITATATNATDGVIELHAAKDIQIKSVLSNYKNTCNFSVPDELTEIVTLRCLQDDVKGQLQLTIDFEGTFTNDMDGLYKSTYVEDGEQHVLLATQFESASARRAFPCFDEPSLKASFDIYITHPTNYSALANTPIVEEFDKGNGQVQTQFETTPVMSTYLVAFIVSKFEASTSNSNHTYDFKVYARPGAKDFTSVATTYGPRLIDMHSSYFGIPYVDLGNRQAFEVAIPDFAAGAMENWGLITFREVDLLDEGSKTGEAARKRIVTVVAHELTHQWFGDYVTLDWWSDTWLNEGFATYFEYHTPNMVDNSFELDKQFVVEVHQSVLVDDAVLSSLPMSSEESDINTQADYSSKFDDISYDKAGSVIRMLKNIIGEDSFKKGLNQYLRENKYSNTNPTLLLNALQANTNGLNLSEIMTTWIYKSGFPLVTVNLNADGASVNLTQERFTTATNNSEDKTQWYVPISYTTSNEKDFSIAIKDWLKPNSVLNVNVSDGSWIIFNIQESGFYRVNYDDTLWDRIIAALKNDTERANIDVLNRAQLVDDIFNIARVGKVGYEKAFDLVGFLNTETDYYSWYSATNAISYIYGKLGDPEAEELLQEVIMMWLMMAFPNGTSSGPGHVDVLKDALIMDWSCKVGHGPCIKYVKETFENYKTNLSLPNYNRRGVVFCYALRESTDPAADYAFLFNVFKNSTVAVEQNAIIAALGCASDEKVLLGYLSETISSNSSIRKQDATYVFRAVTANIDFGIKASLTFLEQNLHQLIDTFKGTSALSNLFTGVANRLANTEDIARLVKIIDANVNDENIKTVGKRAMDIISVNQKWRDTYAATIKAILNKEINSANVPTPKYLFSIILSLTAFYLFH